MAKPLREPPPSSSVVRLFDLDAAARAVAATPAPPESPPPSVAPARSDTSPATITTAVNTAARPCVKRQFILTPASDETFTRLVELYRHTTGTRLTDSHVARALMKGVAHCFDYLEREARRIGRQKLPSNARDKEQERERFEARIADAFIAGIRAGPAMGDD